MATFTESVAERDTLLTIPEIAERMRLARSSVYALIGSGELTTVKIGRSRRVRESDFRAYLASLSDR